MTVYIEYAVLDNFTMDCLLLFCATISLKIRYKWWRIVLAALLGTAIAVFSVYVPGFWVYPVKAVCLFLMCLVAVGWGKKLFWHILLTLTYTFVMGGAIVGIFNLLNVDYLSDGALCYNMPVPLFVCFLAIGLCVFLCYSLVLFVRQNKKIAPYVKKVQVVLDERRYSVTGFCDSGNTVSIDGTPVCFVTKRFRGFSDYFAQQMLSGGILSVNVATLAGSKTVSAVPAKIVCDGATRSVLLALPAEKCSTQYEVLLSGEFC